MSLAALRRSSALSLHVGFGSAQQGNGGLGSGSGQDALQTLDDCLTQAQSSGIWEVDEAVVICPVQEQGAQCSVVEHC